MRVLYILVLIMLLLTSSCEKIFFDQEVSSTNPKENFNYLWRECDEKYAYFDLKKVDWNAVKIKYLAKIYDGMSKDSLFNVMGGMLRELKDDHANLISNFNISFFGVNRLGRDNFSFRVIQDNYLPRNYHISGPFIHDFIDNKNIGYIRFSSFTGTVSPVNLDYILNRYKNTKGLILDIRENGGGVVSDVYKLLSRFITNKTLVAYARLKSGKSHNDFSDSEPVYVEKYGGIRYVKKIAVLTDRGTYSSGSVFSNAIKALPHIILIGDTTGGGLGLPNGGELPNGWTYRFSISQMLTLSKSPDNEQGVPPDILSFFDWSNLKKDEVLERAILELQ